MARRRLAAGVRRLGRATRPRALPGANAEVARGRRGRGRRRRGGCSRSPSRAAPPDAPSAGVVVARRRRRAALGRAALLAGSRPARPARRRRRRARRSSALDVGQGDATLIQRRRPRGPRRHRPARRADRRPAARRGRRAGSTCWSSRTPRPTTRAARRRCSATLPVGLVLDGRDGVRSPDGDRFARGRARPRRAPGRAGGRPADPRPGRSRSTCSRPGPSRAAAHAGADPNQRAIVAELRDGGFSMLLTADAESDVLRGAAARAGRRAQGRPSRQRRSRACRRSWPACARGRR